MAIIKCPECGHQISDKAETCPVCGVRISGNIIKCPHCGNVYLKGQALCPVCHQSPTSTSSNVATTNTEKATTEADKTATTSGTEKKKSNKNKIIAIIIAVVVILAGGLWYANSMNSLHGDEQTAYLNAMQSSDPAVLQDYLDSFKDAPQEHIDSIQAHLDMLRQNDSEWTNAVLSNSKSALQQYLESHPNSLHRTEALHKIDSIDWATCSRMNTPEAYQNYLTEHSDGEHAVDAQEKLDKLDATTVNDMDKKQVSSVFKQFFTSINNNDEMGLTSTVSSELHFLTNPNATKQDVISFLHKLYKDDVSSLTWRPNNDYNIKKTDNGDNTYEYDVEFTVDEAITTSDAGKKFNQYKVKGHIDKNSQISNLQLIKIG